MKLWWLDLKMFQPLLSPWQRDVWVVGFLRPEEEICRGLPIAKFLGFSWTPGAYNLIANDAAIVKHILKDEFPGHMEIDD